MQQVHEDGDQALAVAPEQGQIVQPLELELDAVLLQKPLRLGDCRAQQFAEVDLCRGSSRRTLPDAGPLERLLNQPRQSALFAFDELAVAADII
ncbi:MAG: hypothetical protein F4X59_17830 [Holophagales bacterium]|nr:hypothetical protein [Holophagales bacterium]MYC11967.1 hypothetical protein [Holophagales bacterium]